jgi:hypothetical protein
MVPGKNRPLQKRPEITDLDSRRAGLPLAAPWSGRRRPVAGFRFVGSVVASEGECASTAVGGIRLPPQAA